MAEILSVVVILPILFLTTVELQEPLEFNIQRMGVQPGTRLPVIIHQVAVRGPIPGIRLTIFNPTNSGSELQMRLIL